MSQLTQFMPPPETYDSEIGSQPTMCQVCTGAYASLHSRLKNRLYCLPPKKDYHVYISRSIYHYVYARQTQVNWKKRNKEHKKRKERKEKRRKRKKTKKERKEKKRQEKQGKARQEGHPLVLVLHRPHQSIRLRRRNPSVGCPCSFWRATENARRHPPIPRRHGSMRAAG